MLAWAEPPKTWSASAGGIDPGSLPAFRKRSWRSSAPAMPPSALPKLTPVSQSGSLSSGRSSPASRSASEATARENWA